MTPPTLPFAGYKWRWASLEPSEGLNEPEVFLGVLRVLAKNEGRSPGDARVLTQLGAVQVATHTRVNLVRNSDRNLIRNSGQYWIALGLLESTRGGNIELTDLGRRVASGDVTAAEFAAATVRNHSLPNVRIEDPSAWRSAGLVFRPFQVILEVLKDLTNEGLGEAYLTRSELVKIVIPLAGERRPTTDCVEAIRDYRTGALTLAGWPDCAPSANDHRMAGEFLRFLDAYGYCVKTGRGADEPYVLKLTSTGIDELLAGVDPSLEASVEAVKARALEEIVERQRVVVEVLARPQQARFRRDVLAAYGATCILTGTAFAPVLEAAHIKPVGLGGGDAAANGVCLRSDVHYLFDSGHIRIDRDGNVKISEALAASGAYALPAKVAWPAAVDRDLVDFRWNYT